MSDILINNNGTNTKCSQTWNIKVSAAASKIQLSNNLDVSTSRGNKFRVTNDDRMKANWDEKGKHFPENEGIFEIWI